MVPQTGSTAIRNFLIEYLDGKWLVEENIKNIGGEIMLWIKHNSIPQLLNHNLLTELNLSELNTFATVRNPFDSLVSLYYKKKHRYQKLLSDSTSWIHENGGAIAKEVQFCKEHTFDEWLSRKYRDKSVLHSPFKPKKESLFNSRLQRVQHIIKFESLQSDFEHLMRQFGIKGLPIIPEINPTEYKPKNYTSAYSKTSKRLVEKVFREDLNAFHYSY